MNEAALPSILAKYATEVDDFSSQDLAIPYLVLLQSLSPQVQKRRPEYVQGAEPGMIYNTVTNEVFHHIEVVPCRFQRRYVAWRVRSEGGGIVQDYGSDPTVYESIKPDSQGRRMLDQGVEVTVSAVYHVLYHSNDDWHPAVISMSSSQWRKARRWNSLITGLRHNGIKLPIFARIYVLSSVEESNPNGTWFGWHIEGGRILLDEKDIPLIERASEFRSMLVEGKSSQKLLPPAASIDDDVPF